MLFNYHYSFHRAWFFFCFFFSVPYAVPLTSEILPLPAGSAHCSDLEIEKPSVETGDCTDAIHAMSRELKSQQHAHDQNLIFTRRGVKTTIGVPLRTNSKTCSVVIDLVNSAVVEAKPDVVARKMNVILRACVKEYYFSYGGYTLLGT